MFNIHLNTQQLKIISDALVQMPYYASAQVIEEINKQIIRQQTMHNDNKVLSDADESISHNTMGEK